jgi:hypothetical protein
LDPPMKPKPSMKPDFISGGMVVRPDPEMK